MFRTCTIHKKRFQCLSITIFNVPSMYIPHKNISVSACQFLQSCVCVHSVMFCLCTFQNTLYVWSIYPSILCSTVCLSLNTMFYCLSVPQCEVSSLSNIPSLYIPNQIYCRTFQCLSICLNLLLPFLAMKATLEVQKAVFLSVCVYVGTHFAQSWHSDCTKFAC